MYKANIDKINIVISPSQQKNLCKMGDYEKDHCRKIANYMCSTLNQDQRFNAVVVPDYSNYCNYLELAVAFSNKHYKENNKSIHICIHSDAFDGKSKGASAFYYSDKSFGKILATQIHKNLCNLTTWRDKKCYDRPELAELKNTLSPAALLEISFHDELVQAKWIHENISKISQAIIIGIYEAFSIKKESNTDLKFLKDNGLIFGQHENKDSVSYEELNIILERFYNLK